MSSSFYVILPSNTIIEGNRTNSFRVRLPRKLQFTSEWYVGLAVMVYPHSWPSLGTTSGQYVNVVWKTGERIQLAIPSSSFTSPQELADTLRKALRDGSEDLAKGVRTAQMSLIDVSKKARDRAKNEHDRLTKEREGIAKAVASNIEDVGDMEETSERHHRAAAQSGLDDALEPIPNEEDLYNQFLNEGLAGLDDEDRKILDETKEKGLEAWVHAYRNVNFTCRLTFDPEKNRFTIRIDQGFVKEVELSEQLAYILGYDQLKLTETTMAKFMPDMRGGVSSFHVYAPGLIEPMMFGDVTAPLLRIVTIRGKEDEIIEEQFMSIQYHKLLVKEVAEIFIEIRSTSGALMPFQYGTCCLTLHFKKAAYF